MGRKILLKTGEASHLLEEMPADDEAQLQELLNANPHLLPIEDFELSGPVMVVGRETTLPSGSVDLVCLVRSGDILIIEFKTGPDNADFRHAAAQLQAYGSHLWSLTFEEFESAVALRYFASERCPKDAPTWRSKSLREAAKSTWPDLGDEDWAAVRQRIEDQLETGGFRYVLAAQHFRPSMERTLRYLNQAMAESRFYAVELVRFRGDGTTAFEARTIIRPDDALSATRNRVVLHEQRFLEHIEDDEYRDVLEQLFDTCRALDLRFEWGSRGTSIRLLTSDRAEPLSIAWVFPPGVVGWMGLTNLTLGFDSKSAKATPSVAGALASYLGKVGTIGGAKPLKTSLLEGWSLDPPVVKASISEVVEAVTELVESANAGS